MAFLFDFLSMMELSWLLISLFNPFFNHFDVCLNRTREKVGKNNAQHIQIFRKNNAQCIQIFSLAKSKGNSPDWRNLSGILCYMFGLFMVHHLVTWFDYGPVAVCSAHNKHRCHTYFVMGGSAIFIFAPVFRLQNEYSSKYFGISVSVMTVTALQWHFQWYFLWENK